MKLSEPQPGDTFNRLSFISMAGTVIQAGERRQLARFACQCGTECIKPLARVKSGRTKSCGCLRSETNRINGSNSRPPQKDEIYVPSHPHARLIRARHNRDLVATGYPVGSIGSSLGMV